MFERGSRPDQARLTATPSVSLNALSALAELLQPTSSNASHSGAQESSHDQHWGEDHDYDNAKVNQHERTPEGGAWRWWPTQRVDLFGDERSSVLVNTPAWQDLPADTQAVLTNLMARLISNHVETRRAGSKAEAGHDL